MNRKLFGILLVGVFVLQSCLPELGTKYKRKPLQSHVLAIVETDVEKVGSGVLKVFEDNGVELELSNSLKAVSSDGYQVHTDHYFHETGRFLVYVWADYSDDFPFPRLDIAVYPARFGSKEYDSINNRFEAIVDGLVESGLFQLQSSSFDEDYLDPLSVVNPSCR